jgi:F-type H+-transporting ATPase subunit b
MLIDWFTVGAQALNFLVLAWLLKRFLYKPILDAIDTREKRIAAELADADARKAEAGKERDDFQHKNEAFDQERAALLGKATEEANAERQRLIDEARKAADLLSAKRREALRTEARSMVEGVSQRAREEVFAIGRKVLADLAGTSLEARMGEVFTHQLQDMDGKSKAELAEALKASADPALVRTAYELPEQQQTAIKAALRESISTDLEVRFETAPDLICGIEISANGHKVAWSVSDTLRSLEKCVDEILKLKVQDEPDTKVEPKAK